jgi:secreted Zn-dependent insulinase-like peptidase
MDDADFERHKQAFVQLLDEKPVNLNEKTKRLWFEIENERYEWGTSSFTTC